MSHGTVVRLVTSSAREVTTLRRYTNVFIIIIIIIITDADVLFCLYVCLSDRERISMHILMHVVSGRGLILLWQRCDMLCTSGFEDDAMFSPNAT